MTPTCAHAPTPLPTRDPTVPGADPEGCGGITRCTGHAAPRPPAQPLAACRPPKRQRIHPSRSHPCMFPVEPGCTTTASAWFWSTHPGASPLTQSRLVLRQPRSLPSPRAVKSAPASRPLAVGANTEDAVASSRRRPSLPWTNDRRNARRTPRQHGGTPGAGGWSCATRRRPPGSGTVLSPTGSRPSGRDCFITLHPSRPRHTDPHRSQVDSWTRPRLTLSSGREDRSHTSPGRHQELLVQPRWGRVRPTTRHRTEGPSVGKPAARCGDTRQPALGGAAMPSVFVLPWHQKQPCTAITAVHAVHGRRRLDAQLRSAAHWA